MRTKKKVVKKKAKTAKVGFANYQSFIKSKTKKEALKVLKLERELKAAKKAKASATKKAQVLFRKKSK